jgi:hypothetical protein
MFEWMSDASSSQHDCLACNEDAVGWTSDTALACSAPGPGVGSIAIAITVASQLCTSGCSAGTSLLKYNPPSITSIVASPRPLPIGGRQDGAVISIHGTGFGHTDQGATATLGATSCPQVKWASETFPLYSDLFVLNVLALTFENFCPGCHVMPAGELV